MLRAAPGQHHAHHSCEYMECRTPRLHHVGNLLMPPNCCTHHLKAAAGFDAALLCLSYSGCKTDVFPGDLVSASGIPGQYMSMETSGSDTGRSTGMSCLAKLCSTRSFRACGWPCSSPAAAFLSKTRLLWCCSSLIKPRAAPTMSELYSSCTPATRSCKTQTATSCSHISV